jgi:hypothetical protein
MTTLAMDVREPGIDEIDPLNGGLFGRHEGLARFKFGQSELQRSVEPTVQTRKERL